MAPFWNSNPISFKKLPLEDLPQDQDPIDVYCYFYRIVAEFGFVSTICAGVCFQRGAIMHQSSPAAEVAKIVAVLAGAFGFGANIACLYDKSFLAPKYNYLRPLPPRRRWRRHRTQE